MQRPLNLFSQNSQVRSENVALQAHYKIFFFSPDRYRIRINFIITQQKLQQRNKIWKSEIKSGRSNDTLRWQSVHDIFEFPSQRIDMYRIIWSDACFLEYSGKYCSRNISKLINQGRHCSLSLPSFCKICSNIYEVSFMSSLLQFSCIFHVRIMLFLFQPA